tara:strand:- start:19286 stop:21673 length:2388 start_codon:yes stop_codon:yes gene_type:complete
MALSFGIGYSSDLRDARERLKGKRLKNKELFDTWLSEKREAGESVSLEELEQKKFELTNGDSLYANMIGNEAVLKDKSFRHNQVVADKLVAEATASIENLSKQKSLYAGEMSTKDKNFEEYQKRVSKLFGKGDEVAGKLAMKNAGIDEEWWNKESQKLYQAQAQDIMTSYKWDNVQEIGDIKKLFPNQNAEIISILENNFKGQERRIRSERIAKVMQDVDNRDVTGYISYDDALLKEQVKLTFEANGITNPSELEIQKALGILKQRQKHLRHTKLDGFKRKFSSAFYGSKFLNEWIEKSSDVMPSNDELENVIMEAMGTAGLPAWASNMEGFTAETIMQDGQWASWIDEALGANWSTDIRRAMYARTWQTKDEEQQAAMESTVKDMVGASFAGLTLQAENKERYGEIFKTGKDDKDNGIGFPALGELAKDYYVPRTQRQDVVDYLASLFKDDEGISSVTAVDKVVEKFGLQRVEDWKANEIAHRASYDEGAILPPNTDFQNYANNAAINVKTSIVDEAVKTIVKLPKRDKQGSVWMYNSRFQDIKQKTLEALNKQKKQIIKHITGNGQYAFINQDNPFDLVLGDETIRVTSMEEAKEHLIKYVDKQIEYVNDEFKNLTPEGKNVVVSFDNVEAGGMPTEKIVELNSSAKARGWIVGNNDTSLIVQADKGLKPNPNIWNGYEINEAWMNADGNKNRGALIAIALDIMSQTDNVDKQKKLFRNIVMFGLENENGKYIIDDDTRNFMSKKAKGHRQYSSEKMKDTHVGYGIGYGGATFLERLFIRAISEAKAFEESQQ